MSNTIDNVTVKVGILNTIAKTIYSDFHIKLREAVSNSIDNSASDVFITIDKHTNALSIFDNGTGISKKKFNEIFESIGYGDRSDKSINSYFGLGLMSILQIGKKAQILSRCKLDDGSFESNKFIVKSHEIFSDENEDNPMSTIKEQIEIYDLVEDRNELSFLSDNNITKQLDTLPETYTEILLHDIDPKIIDELSKLEFKQYLTKILPLKHDYDNEFFDHIKSSSKLNQLKNEIFDNPNFCKTLDVFLGINDFECKHERVQKYYPSIRNDISFYDADIYVKINENYAMYFLVATQDLVTKGNKDSGDTGFWVRNQNFLVKSADFFKKRYTRQKLIDQPLQKWIYGEIYHKNMTEMLVVTRDEYLWESKKFVDFYEEIENITTPINKEYREIWKRGKRILDTIVDPLQQSINGSYFKTIEKVLKESNLFDNKDDNTILEEFRDTEFSNNEIESEVNSIEELLKSYQEDIVLNEEAEGDIIVKISKEKIDNKNKYVKERDKKTNKLIIKISPDLFMKFKINFFSTLFDVIYVFCKDSDGDISINNDEKKIFINLANQNFNKYRLSYLEVLFIVKIAFKYSNKSTIEMKNIILDMLGKKMAISNKQSIAPNELLDIMEQYMKRRSV